MKYVALIFIVNVLVLIYAYLKDSKKVKMTLNKRNAKSYAIIIPARYESDVIEGILKSIYPKKSLKDTYIIVEDINDETCKIANKYNANIFVRHVKENTKRKGYALDECLKDIIKDKHYDLYFIFDADNILDKDYIKNMIETYEEGYDIACGYRAIKNKDNVISNSSGLIFTMINECFNKLKSKHNKQIILSGTGFYISGELIEKLNGYPFYSLTEDYELSLYARENNISTYYNNNAIYYDEQPTDMKTSINQRTRWVKGFFTSRKKHKHNSVGVTPIIFMLICFVIWIINTVYLMIIGNNLLKYLTLLVLILIIIYSILFVFTTIILIVDKNKIKFNNLQRIKVVLFNPIFLLTFIISFFKAITRKDIQWTIIKHNKR